jgi:hypothetical protein
MGDISFQNNVPDLLLSGRELRTFKSELEKSKGKVLGDSLEKFLRKDVSISPHE